MVTLDLPGATTSETIHKNGRGHRGVNRFEPFIYIYIYKTNTLLHDYLYNISMSVYIYIYIFMHQVAHGLFPHNPASDLGCGAATHSAQQVATRTTKHAPAGGHPC